MGPLSNYFLHSGGRQISFQWHPLTTWTLSQNRRQSSPYSSFCLPFSLYSHNLYPYLAVSLSSLFRPPFTPITLRLSLLMFWLFVFQDYIVPSLCRPWQWTSQWKFHPHTGNQRAGMWPLPRVISAENILGTLLPHRTKIGTFQQLVILLEREEKNRAVEKSFPSKP